MKATLSSSSTSSDVLPRERKSSESQRTSNERSRFSDASEQDEKPYLPPISTTLECFGGSRRLISFLIRASAGSRAIVVSICWRNLNGNRAY